MNLPIKTKWLDEVAKLNWYQYESGQHCLRLTATDGEPLMTVTSNVPELKLSPDEILVKNYSENEGILEELIRHRIILPPHGGTTSGHAVLYLCKLLIKPEIDKL